jgi:hypothetical protein
MQDSISLFEPAQIRDISSCAVLEVALKVEQSHSLAARRRTPKAAQYRTFETLDSKIPARSRRAPDRNVE